MPYILFFRENTAYILPLSDAQHIRCTKFERQLEFSYTITKWNKTSLQRPNFTTLKASVSTGNPHYISFETPVEIHVPSTALNSAVIEITS